MENTDPGFYWEESETTSHFVSSFLGNMLFCNRN